MPNPPRTLIQSLLPIAAILFLAAAAWRAGASGAAPAAAPPPTAVAVADYNRIHAGLKEISDRNVKLAEQGNKYAAELGDLEKKLKDLDVDLRNTKPGSKEWFELRLAIKENQDVYASRTDGINKRVQLLIGNGNREVYQKFVGTVDYLAKRDGWDIVLLDDRDLIQIPDLASSGEVRDAITRRTILFALPKADITDTIIAQMNTDYAASPPVDRAPAPPVVPTAKQ
jgi:Skp family chaperone for outer membrane proteins